MTAHPDAAARARSTSSKPEGPLARLLNGFSIVTMAMTVPQAVTVWQGHGAGVSLFSWLAYLVSACLWMVHGVRERDKAIWVPCIGWIALDGAIVVGLLLRG